MRLRSPSVLGAITGFLLTTIAYVSISRNFSLTQGGGSTDVLRHVEPPPSFLIHPGSRDSGGSVNGVRIEEELLRRKPLLRVVATSRYNFNTVIYRLNATWSQDWKMAISTKKLQVSGEFFMLTPECQDYPRFEYLLPRQLFCLMEAVYRLYRFHYQWFVFATDSVYISASYLERLLIPLDSDRVIYMGKPHVNYSYCTGESGLILSQAALERIVPHLQRCLEAENLREKASSGDMALGACFEAKLQTACYEWDEPASYFVTNLDGISVASHSNWIKAHKDFATVYPVRTTREMQILHILDQMRELEYYQNKARMYSEKLHNSSFCHFPLQAVDIDLDPPQKANEVTSWSVANPNSTYFTERLEPREWYDGDLRLEIEMMAKRSLEHFNRKNSDNLKYRRVLYGFFRYLGTQGREYILDVETESKTVKKFHILRPLFLKPILLEDSGLEAINKMIDFIVPLSNVRSRFMEFIKTYEDLCLRVDEKCRLNLVVYGKRDLDIIQSNLTVYKAKYPNAQFNLIAGEGQFSRGRALHTGISTLQKSDLAFTCDVDMTIDRSFLNRCRRNPIQGRRVYYPEVFKYYDMDYVYRFESKPLFGYDISRKHGHWCTYGYGMLCIYKSDYDDVGGYDTTIEGWGGEDIQLIDNVIKRGYEVMRAPDPSLSHRHHPKVCSKKLTNAQHSQCVSSRNEDIADRRRLADYIYYLENKCKVKKKIWD